MKYLLLLLTLCCLTACAKEEIYPLMDMNPIEGVWQANWTTNTQGEEALVDIEFVTINKSAYIKNLPLNRLGYVEEEIIFRYLEITAPEWATIQGEMLMKDGNPANDRWVPVEMQYDEQHGAIYTVVNCSGICYNTGLYLLRKQ